MGCSVGCAPHGAAPYPQEVESHICPYKEMSPLPPQEDVHLKERPLTPRETAPPPPPLTLSQEANSYLAPARASFAPVLAGLGRSIKTDASEAAREAWAEAIASLSLNPTPVSLCNNEIAPSITIVACGGNISDPEEVRYELVRASPDALLHGTASSCDVFASRDQACGSRELSESHTVGCLLLRAPPGSFATSWDDCGDAADAAKWLQEQMPDLQAIIMASASENKEADFAGIRSVFPQCPVYANGHLASSWQTLSHLGSSATGVSLLGIGPHVAFGAADIPLSRNASTTDCIEHVFELAMSAGQLSRATAALVTYCGSLEGRPLWEEFQAKVPAVCVLGLTRTCIDVEQNNGSIRVLVFGERDLVSTAGIAVSCKEVSAMAEDETSSTSTACPHSPENRDLHE